MNMQKIHLSRKRIFRFIAALFCLFQLAAAFLFRSTEAGSIAASAGALLAHGGVAGLSLAQRCFSFPMPPDLPAAFAPCLRFAYRRRFRCCFYCCAGWALALPLG